jgi:hypothetical protein
MDGYSLFCFFFSRFVQIENVYQRPLEMLKINQNLKYGGLFSDPVAAVSLPKAMKRYPGSDLRGYSTPSENTFLSFYVKCLQ